MAQDQGGGCSAARVLDRASEIAETIAYAVVLIIGALLLVGQSARLVVVLSLAALVLRRKEREPPELEEA